MGVFSFLSSAGSKLFGGKKPSEVPNLQSLIRDHVAKIGLPSKHIHYWLEEEVMVVSGWVDDKPTKEKVIIAVGNVEGVDKVEDRLVVGAPPAALTQKADGLVPAATETTPVTAEAPLEAELLPTREQAAEHEWSSRTHTVQKGDTLSKIAKEVYGNAGKYPIIFEANQPMLSHPDKIYPGQVLRIPALGEDGKPVD
ncbi:MAG: LysM peptidoglycan-binding domain-containing protein [Lysobacterales bacterium]